MDIQQYIGSGILALYCLGSLSAEESEQVRKMMAHPAVREEIEKIQLAIEALAESNAIVPPLHLNDAMYDLIDNLEREKHMHRDNLPLINRFSKHRPWLDAIKKYIPATINEGMYCKVLTNTPTLKQMLVVSTSDFKEEMHTDLIESFLILDGYCDCTVDRNVRRMKAGDFMEIPLHALHDVKLKSPAVVAILQHMALQ